MCEQMAGQEIQYTDPPLKDLPATVKNFPRRVLLWLIKLYQMTFSKTLPPNT